MNPSTALGTVLVDELVRGGVREAVLSPGSRSAPLAFALHEAHVAGRLRLHVRIDERSAAFLALGLAKASGRPVPAVTTSGTATANLHPAVIEADLARVPLVVVTADRPHELRGTGANQTIDQVGLYGRAPRLFLELAAPEERPGQNRQWRSTVCRVLAAATGWAGGPPGPVHVNVALREPLVPSAGTWVEPLDGRPDGATWTQAVQPAASTPVPDDLPDRTVVVLGDGDPAQIAEALHLAAARGFPVIAEPSSGAASANVVPAGAALLAVAPWCAQHRPDRVLVVGRPTLSRVIGGFVAQHPTDLVAPYLPWPDPSGSAERVLPSVPVPATAGPGPATSWLDSWLTAGRSARAAVERLLGQTELSEPGVAAEVLAADHDLLVVGSSKPVRDLLLVGGRPEFRVLANRGAAGIDGMVSTAMGAALAHGGRTVALLGDLTFLHDVNGLLLGPAEDRPDLTVVVVNNDGGAIFGLLEQGDPAHAAAFEHVFGTPHGADLSALCAATATPHVLVTTRAELREALRRPGLQVVEVRTDRAAEVARDAELRAAVQAAVLA